MSSSDQELTEKKKKTKHYITSIIEHYLKKKNYSSFNPKELTGGKKKSIKNSITTYMYVHVPEQLSWTQLIMQWFYIFHLSLINYEEGVPDEHCLALLSF